jgi:hypothetical protein
VIGITCLPPALRKYSFVPRFPAKSDQTFVRSRALLLIAATFSVIPSSPSPE